MRSKLERGGIVVTFAVAILFNYLANSVPLGGQTTGEISDRYSSMFTPAGFTFAIWGVIYLLLLGFVFRQLQARENRAVILSQISVPFIINCVANASWILAWHYDQLALSMFFMLVILTTLFRINQLISQDASLSAVWDRTLIIVPFSVYFGWISVATIANISVLQSSYGLNDVLMSQVTWTLLKLAAAAVIAYLWGWRRSRPAFLFVISWAAFGISVANSDQSIIEWASRILALIALVAGVFLLRSRPTEKS